ncbi:MAG: ATP-binding protein [Myxococcota bacterium]
MPDPSRALETEALLRTLFRETPDAVGVSRARELRVANAAMVRLFGCDDEAELVGRPLGELLASDSADQPGLHRIDAIRRGGERFLLEIRNTTLSHGGETFCFALMRDVADERRTAEAMYDAIFTRNTAMKLLIDPTDGTIVDANPAAVEFYGWPVQEMRGMPISRINLLPPEVVARELRDAQQGTRQVFRFRHRVASGEVRGVEVHSGTVDVDGRALLLSILQDTTERDALEEQLRQAQKLEAVGRLAGGVAHDFNNLLTLMMSCGDLLRRDLPERGSAHRYLDDLMHAATRASELTRQLLAVGQRQHLRPSRVALDEVILRIEGLLRGAAGPGVALRLDLESKLGVEADPGQLEQVITNLVLNARSATGGHGTIEIRAGRVDDVVELSVRDDGAGMDAATRARVFEPFFTTQRDGSGSGLGLASVYGIVTQSGGTIAVESEPGRGATFRIRLPARTCPERSAAPPPAGRPFARVLLVEDEDSLRGVLAESLHAEGLAVHTLSSGDEALALSEGDLGAVDVLVTDHAMPGCTGVDVARELVRRRPGLAVVLISAHVSATERARLPAGARFLAKPFSGADLARTIREVLAARPDG